MLLASKEKGGAANICVISSTSGKNPPPSIGIYGSTKAALDNMVKFLALELMGDGIRINSLAPGIIRTDFAGPLIKNPDVPPEAIGDAYQIGSVAALICSKHDGGFMNGEIYTVAGGFSSGKL